MPRAALTADQIAEEAEFFSFGTNDLTQTTFGISRDDINNFLPAYLKLGIFKQDPFATLDQAGVGQLVKMATAKGRNTRPTLKVGICGEHGGDPESVKFCHKIGLNYVSCSPFRLLTARLAAAQAALEEKTGPATPTSNPPPGKIHGRPHQRTPMAFLRTFSQATAKAVVIPSAAIRKGDCHPEAQPKDLRLLLGPLQLRTNLNNTFSIPQDHGCHPG